MKPAGLDSGRAIVDDEEATLVRDARREIDAAIVRAEQLMTALRYTWSADAIDAMEAIITDLRDSLDRLGAGVAMFNEYDKMRSAEIVKDVDAIKTQREARLAADRQRWATKFAPKEEPKETT